ncbi:MAG: sensor histidine kinase [Vallitaleaceae bacterium]|nr:sensor histidine kinase [Vallitaleaceae bacterium]
MIKRFWGKVGEINHIRSIQLTISLAFSMLIIVVVAIVGFLSYTITGNTVEKNSSEYVYQLIKQVNYDIEYYLKNVEYIAGNLQYKKNVQTFFKSDGEDNYLQKYTIQQELDAIVEARKDIINIMLIGNDGQLIVNNPKLKLKTELDFKDQSWYMKALQNKGIQFSESHVQNLFVGQYDWVVSCSTLLEDPTDGSVLGMLLIDLNYNLINDMVSKIELGEKGYLFVISPDGDMVYHPKQQLLYSDIKKENINLILKSPDGNIKIREDGLDKQYTIATSSYSGWKVVGAVYLDDLAPYAPYLKRFFVIVSFLAVLVAVLSAVLLSSNMLHPIKDILKSMNQFRNGDLDARIEIQQNNEISQIAKEFNAMTIQIKTLIKENKEVEKTKRKTELKALQDQINPHFLYNTLDSIVWMSEVGNNKDVVTMTSSLAKLFRISISKGNQFITLAEELEHIKSYLTIQKIRYGNKLEYNLEVDETLLKNKVVKIIIQPIVENAIYHGIKNMPGTGTIVIKVAREKEGMAITVSDDGVGMTQEQIDKILRKVYNKEKDSQGVGISNVVERIKLNYGEEYGLQFMSEPYGGTQVKIILPIEY